jgi:hypothetical protein
MNEQDPGNLPAKDGQPTQEKQTESKIWSERVIDRMVWINLVVAVLAALAAVLTITQILLSWSV